MEPLKEVRVLEKEIIPFIKKAEVLKKILNANDMKLASELRVNLKQYASTVKSKKDFILKPILEGVKNLRSMFAPIETRVEANIEKLNGLMTAYQTEEKRRSDEEAMKIASRIGEGKGKLKVDTAIKKLEEIEKPDNKVFSDSGATKFKTTQKFKVMDITMLPHEYVLANEVLIRKAMLEGIKLPGVDYYTEETPVNSR